jgi:valyl-tRNA synthetase
MSKSLGNSPDPLDLIEKFGADGVRVGILISSPAGNDLPFDTSQCEQGRNFANKIWNAFRLITSWEVMDLEQPKASIKGIEWFDAKLNQELSEIDILFKKFKISEALMATYKLVWDDFCSWYLEIIKPGYQQPIDRITLEATLGFFEKILKIIQPFTPFIAEEIWHIIRERKEGDDIVIANWPEVTEYNPDVLAQFKVAEEVITNIRNIRKENNIATKVKMDLFMKQNQEIWSDFDSVIVKIGNLSQLEYTKEKIANAYSFLVHSNEFFIPFGDSVDVESERKKIEEELQYTKGFLQIVQNKLTNEKFVSGAPDAVVANEKKKEADALHKITILEDKLASFVE